MKVLPGLLHGAVAGIKVAEVDEVLFTGQVIAARSVYLVVSVALRVLVEVVGFHAFSLLPTQLIPAQPGSQTAFPSPSNAYPFPQTVPTYRGFAGSGSIFSRSRLMFTLLSPKR